MKNINVAIGNLILKNIPPLRTCDSREIADIIFKANKVPRDLKIPSRDTIRGKILDTCYTTTS